MHFLQSTAGKARSLILLATHYSLLATAAFAASVLDYGAIPNDDKDDTAAFQKAINAAAENSGGVIHIPAGRYLLSSTLLIEKPGITLQGEGRGSISARNPAGTVLTLDSEKTNTAILIRNAAYSGVKNLSLEQKNTPAPTAQNQRDALIVLQNTYHSFIKELLVSNPLCALEIIDGMSPLVEDLDIKAPTGAYAIWLHGSGKNNTAGKYKKVDAATLFRIAGSAESNPNLEWLVIGPNVDGAELNTSRFVAGGRGFVLRGGNPSNGDIRPKYIYTHKFGCDHVALEGALLEAGSDVFMTNTWIGQNKNATGFVVGPDFLGGLLINNLRIRGAGRHGMHIMGGENIYITNPLIGASARNKNLIPKDSTEGTGILIEAKVTKLRITGGGVCEMYDQGGGSNQHTGIRYLGTPAQSDANSVKIDNVDTQANPLPFTPANLSTPKN